MMTISPCCCSKCSINEGTPKHSNGVSFLLRNQRPLRSTYNGQPPRGNRENSCQPLVCGQVEGSHSLHEAFVQSREITSTVGTGGLWDPAEIEHLPEMMSSLKNGGADFKLSSPFRAAMVKESQQAMFRSPISRFIEAMIMLIQKWGPQVSENDQGIIVGNPPLG